MAPSRSGLRLEDDLPLPLLHHLVQPLPDFDLTELESYVLFVVVFGFGGFDRLRLKLPVAFHLLGLDLWQIWLGGDIDARVAAV